MSIYPFITSDNICMRCGKTDSIKYVDMRGSIRPNTIYTVCGAICTSCKAKYFLKWKIGEDGKAISYYSSLEDIENISEKIEKFSLLNRRPL